ncbi:hypothetical protein D3C75_438790 [compost metagenome]
MNRSLDLRRATDCKIDLPEPEKHFLGSEAIQIFDHDYANITAFEAVDNLVHVLMQNRAMMHSFELATFERQTVDAKHR